MTGDKSHLRRARGLIVRECSAKLMSNAKWAKTISALRGLPVRFRIKLLGMGEPSPWDHNFVEVPVPYIELPKLGPVLALEVEWLEIDALEHRYHGRLVADELIDHTAEVVSRLSGLRIPLERDGSILRITGYVKRDDSRNGRRHGNSPP